MNGPTSGNLFETVLFFMVLCLCLCVGVLCFVLAELSVGRCERKIIAILFGFKWFCWFQFILNIELFSSVKPNRPFHELAIKKPNRYKFVIDQNDQSLEWV